MKRIVALIGIFSLGLVSGALGLRQWQKTKPYVVVQGVSANDVKRQLFKFAARSPNIIMLGDSIMDEANWAELTGCGTIASYALSGDTSEGILARLDEVLAAKPRAVFLMIGANDIGFRTPREETAHNIAEIVRRLHNTGIAVVFHPVLPIKGATDLVSRLNKAVLSKIGSTKVIELPITEPDLRDGLHLNTYGYVKWRDAIAPLVSRYCA